MIHGSVGKHEGQGGRNRDDSMRENEKAREDERTKGVPRERKTICGD
jgi:hypothetical protein